MAPVLRGRAADCEAVRDHRPGTFIAMSWRDETPPHVQDDLDLLLDRGLHIAQEVLEKNGEFYPFAVRLTDHEPVLVAADPGQGEQPSSQAVLDLLYAGAREERDNMRAVAFVAAVDIDTGDAIRVECEHRDGGPAIAGFLSYKTKRLRRGVDYGDLSAAAGTRHIWT